MKRGVLFLGMVGAMSSASAVAQEDDYKFYAGAGFGVINIPKEDGIKFSDAHNGTIQFGYKLSDNIAVEAQYSRSTKNAAANGTEEDVDISDLWWQSIVSMNPGTTLSQAQSWFPYAVADMAINLEASIETTSLYAAYRSSGDLYLKLKAGYVWEKAELSAVVDSMDFYVAASGQEPLEFTASKGDEVLRSFGLDHKETISERDSDFSAGIGAGYKFTKNLFSELEFTRLDDDLDFYSVSINYAF